MAEALVVLVALVVALAAVKHPNPHQLALVRPLVRQVPLVRRLQRLLPARHPLETQPPRRDLEVALATATKIKIKLWVAHPVDLEPRAALAILPRRLATTLLLPLALLLLRAEHLEVQALELHLSRASVHRPLEGDLDPFPQV